jgi:hypothetical protein
MSSRHLTLQRYPKGPRLEPGPLFLVA